MNDLQAQVVALVNAVAALSTQNITPAIDHGRNTCASNVPDSDEEDDNPFAPLRRQQQRNNRTTNNNSDSDEEEEGESSWKSCFKLDIPEFKGSTVA